MSEHDLTLSDLEGLDIDDFDSAEYLGSEQAIAAYLTEALASNDASLLAVAIGNVARARGMTEIAKASGLAREGLYKALRPDSQPRMETITRVLRALGVRLVAEAIPVAELGMDPATASPPQGKLEQLRQDIRDDLNSGSAGPWDPDAIKREGRARRKAKAASGA